MYEVKWYEEVPRLLSELDQLYAKIVLKRPEATLLNTTKQKILEHREWASSEYLYRNKFDQVLSQLHYFYVPKIMDPGPMFLFPLLDLEDKYQRAQTKPLEGSIEFGRGKYLWLGPKTYGPSWLGNDEETLALIIASHKVLLVEGPFDLLAVRLLSPPGLSSLCPLTKRIGGKHETYLRMLGVKTAYLLFDNERPKDGHDIGAGNLSMKLLEKQITSMNIEILNCPSDDPSACLKTPIKAQKLKTLLESLCMN